MKKIAAIALFVAASMPLVVALSHGGHAHQKEAASQSRNAAASQLKSSAVSKGAQVTKAPKAAQNSFVVMMSALETDDLAAFVAPGETAFAMAFTQPVFAKISAQMAPRLKKGYQATFLCPMKQRGYDVFLWKLSFKDGGDDLLASLSTKNGKVSGLGLN